MTSALDEVAALVLRESGIRLGASQHSFLQAALDRIGPHGDSAGFLRRASDASRRAALVERLIDEVTIKETSFLRDREQLEGLDWGLMLRAARTGGAERLRVWTTPCATGEEAYTLALLACEAFAPAEPPVTIVATDISGGALAGAREGAYRSRSVRALDPALRHRYFHERADKLVVGERLRSLVTFAGHNLTRDPFPPLGEAPFHLILCRNVLIYFDPPTVARVVASLEGALAPGGALVLGVADVLCRTVSRQTATAAGVPSPPAPAAPLRRPLGRAPAATGSSGVTAHAVPMPPDVTIAPTLRLPAADPLDAEAHFRHGVAQLEGGDPGAAVESLRRALYVDPAFGLAAFTLGGAHEALGEPSAARRAYARALRTLEPHQRHERILGQVALEDVTAAARARLQSLAGRAG